MQQKPPRARRAHGGKGTAGDNHSAELPALVVFPSSAVFSAADLFETVDTEEGESIGGLPTLAEFLAESERSYLQAVLQRFEGKVGSAAAALEISRKTLWERSKRYGLKAEDSAPN